MPFTKIVGAGIQTTTDATVRNFQATGVLTATSLYGDASNLTGIPAGLGTALSQTQTSPLNKIYYTNQILSIGSTVTISPPASAVVAYTQYADIVVEQDVDLIIDDGDEFIPDILGLSTTTGATLSGVGGRVRADQFTNKAGTGAPTFTKGLQVTGVGTALLVTGDARITGILTIGTSSVTLDGTNNQVNVGTGVTIHHTNGVQVGQNTLHSAGITINQINATGVITATSFVGSNANGSISGISTIGLTTAYITNLAGVGIGTSIRVTSGSKIVGLSTGSITYPGAVLQVIQTIKKDTWTASGTDATTFYGPVTGYAATITPTSTSSKILVICSMQIGTGYWEVQGRLVRNGSNITESWGDTRGNRTRCSFAANQYDGGAYGYGWYPVHYTYLDSPGVTTATTYSVMLNPYSGYYVYMNRTGKDNDQADYYGQPASTITLMEISQ